MSKKTVVVLGASNNPERYSYKALKMLAEHGYDVIPVHPQLKDIDGIEVRNSLENADAGEDVYTLTLYVGPEKIVPLIPDIVRLNPQRVIFNPGTESQELKEALVKASIPHAEACTLVLLRTGRFEEAF
ncbi:MAG: CoA-binding protein [Spirochaetes bacterium]|nr:CoA-binding protein [Spirochaetota bacterium]